MNIKRLSITAALMAGLLSSGLAHSAADTLPDIDYTGSDDLVCDAFGDFIGCSISGLNFVDGVQNGTYNLADPSTFEGNGTYTGQFTIVSNQGYLQDQLVIATGNTGQSSLNNDYESTDCGGAGNDNCIDNAYSPPGGAGSLDGFSTNDTPSATELAAGVVPQADPGGTGEFAGDIGDTWDISITALLDFLETGDGLTWDPYFVFANNQVGSGDGQDLSLWAMVSALDIEGVQADINWEFTNGDYTAPGVNTTKNFGNDPTLPDDYVVVDGDFCLNAALIEIDCVADAANVYLYFNNNIGNNVSEFIGFIPELTYNYLQLLLALGYDVLSVDARYFDNTDGFDDIFIVLGSPEPGRSLPEPSSLALLGLGLLLATRIAGKKQRC